jgi:hypothetical protein
VPGTVDSFGPEPELDRDFDGLCERADLRVIVLRVKRTRNPDIVCMESLQHFILEMQAKGVTVMLCGVRTDFHQTMQNLRFRDFLPAARRRNQPMGRFIIKFDGCPAKRLGQGQTFDRKIRSRNMELWKSERRQAVFYVSDLHISVK